MARDHGTPSLPSRSASGVVAELGFFQRPGPVYLILGSFFLLTVPLGILGAADDEFVFQRPIGILYVCVLGMTHFVITFALYLQAANLRYFWSTWGNRLTYFVVPAAIFVFFDLYHALGVAAAMPLLDLGLRYGIRLMDFQHFTRQNFGVLQLFRVRSGERFPDWMRQAENQFFSGLTLLLFVTFLCGGRFRPERPIVVLVLAVVTCLFVCVLGGFALTWWRSRTPSVVLVPLAYFLLQTASAGVAVFSTRLYAIGLAMHYVEYHVLMMPRCFHAPLDSHATTDRWFGRLRRHKLLFYGLLVVLAVPVTRYTWQGMNMLLEMDESSLGVPSRLLIALFDGLFVFHYVIESRIWRFGDPFYRQSLIPLYFRPARPPGAAVVGPGPGSSSDAAFDEPEPVVTSH
jgi:hypothetical protein